VLPMMSLTCSMLSFPFVVVPALMPACANPHYVKGRHKLGKRDGDS